MTPPRLPIARKRSRLAIDPDEAEDEADNQLHNEPLHHPSALRPTPSLKRTRTQCDLDELSISPAHQAWALDLPALLPAPHHQRPSPLILCVQGNLQLHYDLLCAALPDLHTRSPGLRALVLCHDPDTHRVATGARLPMVRAVTGSCNYFVRLGLLHPLGGGKLPLDALVVVDGRARRRLVLPFGWGAGKYVDTPAGRSVQRHMMELLRSCVEMLEREREQEQEQEQEQASLWTAMEQ